MYHQVSEVTKNKGIASLKLSHKDDLIVLSGVHKEIFALELFYDLNELFFRINEGFVGALACAFPLIKSHVSLVNHVG